MQITKCSELKECLGVVFPHRVIVNKSLRLLSISGTYTSIPEHSIVEVVILTVIDVDIPSTDIIAF